MKKFISPYGWFSIEYPDNWFEFEDEEGSFLFYNPNKWTGNLRVSAFKDKSRNYARQLMEDEKHQYKDAQIREIGSWQCVVSAEDFQEEGRTYTATTFLTGIGNTAVEFQFTANVGVGPKVAENVISTLVVRDRYKKYPKEIIPLRVWEIHQIDEAFDWVTKSIKTIQKKDFTGSFEDINRMQELIESGVYPPGQRETWEALGIAFGVILTNEMDGMEWVTVVDGSKEYPALIFQGTDFYLEPMKLIQNKNRGGENCDLRAEFNRIKQEIESKL